jgi:hypothetical protein
MFRFLNKLFRDLRTTKTARPARRAPRRTNLQLEYLEDRLALSTASLVGSTLLVNADPGRGPVFFNGHVFPAQIRQITFKDDAHQPGKLDVLDNGTLLDPKGLFSIASITNVDISVAGFDAVNVDDSNGFPFAPRTSISLFGSGSNSLSLAGTQFVNTTDYYFAGSGPQAGTLLVGGATFAFSGAVTAVTDMLRTADFFVYSLGQGVAVTLSSQNGGTQQLTGLADHGGGGGTLTFSNKDFATLRLSGSFSSARLTATAAATGEATFEVDLEGGGESAVVDAAPSTLISTVVSVTGTGAMVQLNANSAPVTIDGNSTTLVNVGVLHNQTTAGINADVTINGAESILVDNERNTTTREHVTVTESTVSGTGLFGNNAVTLHYSGLAAGPLNGLTIDTGTLNNTYTVIGSHPGAQFTPDKIVIVDQSASAGLNVLVTVDSGSGLNLSLLNYESAVNGSLFISVVGNGQINPSAPPFGQGTETATFLTFDGRIVPGLTSTIFYSGFSSISHS